MRSESSCSRGTLSAVRLILLPAVFFVLMCATACGTVPDAGLPAAGRPDTEKETAAQAPAGTDTAPAEAPMESENETKVDGMKKLRMEIDGTEVPVVWEDNESVAALTELAAKEPVTVQMSMYGGFEQVGPLGTDLPRNDRQTTASAGDIVLYSGDRIVVFYGSNSWAYAMLGHAELSAEEMAGLLGNGDVTVILAAEQK